MTSSPALNLRDQEPGALFLDMMLSNRIEPEHETFTERTRCFNARRLEGLFFCSTEYHGLDSIPPYLDLKAFAGIGFERYKVSLASRVLVVHGHPCS